MIQPGPIGCLYVVGRSRSLSDINLAEEEEEAERGGRRRGILNKRPGESKLLASSYPGPEGEEGTSCYCKKEGGGGGVEAGLAVPLMKQHARQLLPN